MHVFLDVDNLAKGSGIPELDHSKVILVFAMPIYFEKMNCVKELIRAIVRDKPITLLLPDAEVHGVFTEAMLREIVTEVWLKQWKLEQKFREWGMAKVKMPTAADICNRLFKQPPLEWSRITPFQDRTMVLMCQRLLPERRRNIYLQGSASFALPRRHMVVKVYCSPHNLGAAELAAELNATTRRKSKSTLAGASFDGLVGRSPQWASSSKRLSELFVSSSSPSSPPTLAPHGRLLEVVDTMDDACDHMLVYLNALTWTHDPESLEADIREAQRLGVHLQLCHEFPSVLDPGSARAALDFKAIMEATPLELRRGARNIYKQIAIALKGNGLRDIGLQNVAAKLVERVPRAPIEDEERTGRGTVLLRCTAAMSRGELRVSATQRSSKLRDSFRVSQLGGGVCDAQGGGRRDARRSGGERAGPSSSTADSSV